MPAKRQNPGQGSMLLSEGEPRLVIAEQPEIPSALDPAFWPAIEQIAKRAMKRRKSRKGNDFYRLAPRNDGFMKRVGGLWIPYTEGEEKAVKVGPAQEIDGSGERLRELVLEKYLGPATPERQLEEYIRVAFFLDDTAIDTLRQNRLRGECVGERKVAQWAGMVALMGRRARLDSYTEYGVRATRRWGRLLNGIDLQTGKYDAQSVSEKEMVVREIGRYLLTLATFAGRYVKESKQEYINAQQRAWHYDHWVKKIERDIQPHISYFVSRDERGRVELFEEAICSNIMQMRYWTHFERQYREEQSVKTPSQRQKDNWPPVITEEMMSREPF